MITSKDNLFNVIGAEVAASSRDEFYLLAGVNFGTVATTASPEVHRVLGIAMNVVGCNLASDALAAHYNSSVGIQTSHPVFADGCGGFVTTNHVAVQFRVRKVSDRPDTYRVLFVRVDAVRIATAADERITELERRVAELESAD